MSWDEWDPVTGRRRRPRLLGRAKWFFRIVYIILPSIVVAAIAVFIIGTLAISANINAERHTQTCTVSSVVYSPTKSGAPAWSVGTNCGGTLYIDPGATHQSDKRAGALANSITPGGRYILTIQGDLANKFTISSYLLAARPAR